MKDRQGLTMGSMWYDKKTNGGWAVEGHHSSALQGAAL